MNKRELVKLLTESSANYGLLIDLNLYKIAYTEAYIYNIVEKKRIAKINFKTFNKIDVSRFFEVLSFYRQGSGRRLYVFKNLNKTIFKGAE
jgi:hypothetical protein